VGLQRKKRKGREGKNKWKGKTDAKKIRKMWRDREVNMSKVRTRSEKEIKWRESPSQRSRRTEKGEILIKTQQRPIMVPRSRHGDSGAL
jgi:hypothetical protein